MDWETNIKRKLLVIVGALFAAGVILAGILYVTFPVQVTTYGGTARNYLLTLSTPAGTVSTEANPAYQAPVAAAASPPPADACGQTRRLVTGQATTEHPHRSVTRR